MVKQKHSGPPTLPRNTILFLNQNKFQRGWSWYREVPEGSGNGLSFWIEEENEQFVVHSSYSKVYNLRETAEPTSPKNDGSEGDDEHEMAKHEMMLDVASGGSESVK